MLITVASQVKSSIVASTREKDKVFVSVLAGVTLAQLATVSLNFYSSTQQANFKLIDFSHLTL